MKLCERTCGFVAVGEHFAWCIKIKMHKSLVLCKFQSRTNYSSGFRIRHMHAPDAKVISAWEHTVLEQPKNNFKRFAVFFNPSHRNTHLLPDCTQSHPICAISNLIFFLGLAPKHIEAGQRIEQTRWVSWLDQFEGKKRRHENPIAFLFLNVFFLHPSHYTFRICICLTPPITFIMTRTAFCRFIPFLLMGWEHQTSFHRRHTHTHLSVWFCKWLRIAICSLHFTLLAHPYFYHFTFLTISKPNLVLFVELFILMCLCVWCGVRLALR